VERNRLRGVWLPPYSCVVVRNIHGLRSWRRMSAALSPTRNAQAMLRPCVGLWFFFGGIALLLEPIGAPVFIVRVLLFIALLALVVGVVYLLPFPLPRFADPYYQYLKRHDLLDATGKPLPDADIERILAEREDGIPPHA